MTSNVFELSRVRQIGKFWVVEVLSPVSGWIVQGEHLTEAAAKADRKNWM
jgi:hypothetical protein